MDEFQNVYDEVAIFDSGVRVFTDLNFTRMRVNEVSRLVDQPLEDGSSVVDHKVDELAEIAFLTVLPPDDYKNAYQELNSNRIRGTIFTVKTPLRFYDNMVINDVSHEVDGSTPDKVEMVLSFSEYKYFETQFAALPPQQVARPTDASTVKRGVQRGEPVEAADNEEDVSVLLRILRGEGEQ